MNQSNTNRQPRPSQYPQNPWERYRPPYRPSRRYRRRRIYPPAYYRIPTRRRGCSLACLLSLFPITVVAIVLAVYLFFPLRTNILLMGIDYADPGSYVARSDTLILTTFIPLEPYIGMLSIPRDLWVIIPGLGENRINTAHFYAEIQQPGSGPHAALETIRMNFGIDTDYYVRIRFEGFREVVDAMGGVIVDLPKPMAGYDAGKHALTGRKALAFVRHRQGSDDFNRMEQAQFMMKTILKNMLFPRNWPRLPAVVKAFFASVDTNIPTWLWPRLAIALLRAGPNGIDNRIISRQMVTPFLTSEGASVLSPNWLLINPVLQEMFAQ